MLDEKYGRGAALADDESNWVLTHGGPFKPEVIRQIAKDPAMRVSDWAVALFVTEWDDAGGEWPADWLEMPRVVEAYIHEHGRG